MIGACAGNAAVDGKATIVSSVRGKRATEFVVGRLIQTSNTAARLAAAAHHPRVTRRCEPVVRLTGELSGTHFVSADPDQIQTTLGFVWSVRPTLDLSLTGLLGSLSGGDRYGLLFGISTKLGLFK